MVQLKAAVVLGGGKGLRLRPLTETNPKPMVPVLDRPLAQWQVEWLRQQGIEQVVFAVGYLWQKVQEFFGDGNAFGLTVRYSVEDEPLGTGGAFRKGAGLVQGPFLAMNGDVVTDLDLRKMASLHSRLGALATLLAVPFVSPYGIVDINRQGSVKGFIEKPRFPGSWINGGIYILTPEAASRLPAQGDIETTLFPALAREGRLAAYRHEGFWGSADSLKDLQALEKELASRNSPPRG